MLVAAAAFCAALPGISHAAAPSFVEAGPLATDTGHLHVDWTSDEPVTLTIEGEQQGEPRAVFRGNGDGLFLTGLANGEYTLRLTGESGAVSSPLVIEVAHQSLAQALLLAGIGAFVFLLTVAVILRGARDD